jgi:hypothetical protein
MPIIDQVRRTPEDWVWTYHRSPDDLRQNREKATASFCADYPAGKVQGRYEVGELPTLQYADREFDLGLSSHFLFLYSDFFDQDFHFDSICEMLRVCQTVRIFPLLTLQRQRSPYIDPIIQGLAQAGYYCEICKVAYEFQRGGNEMLVISNTCLD